MSTQQPTWKLVGRLGDVDPVAYGGGFVYEDTTGVYAPEIELIDPAEDGQHDEMGDQAQCTISRFIIEPDPTREWWYSELGDVASSCGRSRAEYERNLLETGIMERALVYQDLIGYFGAHEFDSYPLTMTEAEAYARYKTALEVSK